jgi:hypothetical protein
MGGEQANVNDTEHGLTASAPGSFVLNLADARWMRSEIAGQWTDFEPPEGFEHSEETDTPSVAYSDWPGEYEPVRASWPL